jgi:hypothetical protein
MKYVALVYPLFKPGTPYQLDLKKALDEAKEKWEDESKEYRHPYRKLEILRDSLEKNQIPYLYLDGIEVENEEKVKEFGINALKEGVPMLQEVAEGFEVKILPYVEAIYIDPPEDDNKNGNAFLRGLAVVSALVTAITVGWLRGVWSE